MSRMTHLGGVMRLLCTALLCLAACQKSGKKPVDVDDDQWKASVNVQRDSLQIRHGRVGMGNEAQQSTYVLVDVKNTGPQDLDVQVGGELFAKQTSLGPLRLEVMHVPAGATRTFAPVPRTLKHMPEATGAEVFIKRAFPPQFKLRFEITEPTLHTFAGKTLVKFYAHNQATRRVHANILATFRDKNGTVILRPAMKVDMPADEKRVVEIPGPGGATSVDVYVGERIYP